MAVCPNCNGRGMAKVVNPKNGYEYFDDCPVCKGIGNTTYKAQHYPSKGAMDGGVRRQSKHNFEDWQYGNPHGEHTWYDHKTGESGWAGGNYDGTKRHGYHIEPWQGGQIYVDNMTGNMFATKEAWKQSQED